MGGGGLAGWDLLMMHRVALAFRLSRFPNFIALYQGQLCSRLPN